MSESVVLPKAEFIDDVATFLKDKDVDKTLQQFQDHLRVFKMQEQQLMQRRARLLNKLPELQRSLDIVNELISRSEKGEELVADFELAASVHAKARVKDAKSVHLWLGAGVMLEYPLAEAKELLEQNFTNCKKNLKTNEEDFTFIKDCITITEVSVARVYNYDVERRRKEKDEA